jgi:glucose-6-phosphate isomerase
MKPLIIRYEKSALTDAREIETIARSLDEYGRHLNDVVTRGGYDTDEASLNLCDDEVMQKTVAELAARKKTNALNSVFVVGIGGSNLGTYAIYNALRGAYDELIGTTFPKIIFIDTVSTTRMMTVARIIENATSADEICVNVISKSGTTTETIALFEVLYTLLKKKFSSIDERIVVTTDEGSPLHQVAEEAGFAVLLLPKNVGGRYSVFSAVGLFPLALTGVNIANLVEGAKTMRERCLTENDRGNPAIASAVLQYWLYAKKDIRISNSFFFHPELEMIGKWYRQLMGESIGKKTDTNGNIVHAGITPIVSVGSTDLHSMAQLYFGGPRDKFTCFVRVETDRERVSVPNVSERLFPSLVGAVSGKRLDEIMTAIYGGVLTTYRNNELPFAEVVFPEITEESIGQYLQLKMMEMMYLAQLMKVNAFDQPNVEEYKEETRKLLR